MRSIALLIVAGLSGIAVAGPGDSPPSGTGGSAGSGDTATDAGQSDDEAQAEALFAEAVRLKQAGNALKACETFEQALTHNRRAVGTILNVALCDENAGKIATAYKLFAEVRDQAHGADLERHREAALEHLAALEPNVPHVAIAFAEAPTADTKLVIDDQVVPVSTAGNIPVDPGTRTIVVTAPGRVPYETKVEMKAGEHRAVAVPKLGYPVTVHKGRRTIGKVFTFSGAGLVASGIVIGLVARSRYNSQFDNGNCTEQPSGPPSCTTDGYTKTDSARTLGWVGTGVGIAGGAALAVGAFLWYFAPSESSEHQVSVVPTLSREAAGLAAVGRF